VGEAAIEWLERLQPLAELLDGWNHSDTYRSALAAQRSKLEGNDWAVPSARVLEAMGQSGLGHRDWVQAISREHQQTLNSEPLAPEVLADFRAMSAQSLVEQKEQEAADSQSFPEFLEAYLKS
jgi:glutamate--cysteine ligase